MENHEDILRQLQMLQDSQRTIQNQIDSLTQQTSTVRWYNNQLATELPSGRLNLVARTVATTLGLPWELEIIADQVAHVCTILRAKNILPTPGASSLNQLFEVSHPLENLEIHPPDFQIPNSYFLADLGIGNASTGRATYQPQSYFYSLPKEFLFPSPYRAIPLSSPMFCLWIYRT